MHKYFYTKKHIISSNKHTKLSIFVIKYIETNNINLDNKNYRHCFSLNIPLISLKYICFLFSCNLLTLQPDYEIYEAIIYHYYFILAIPICLYRRIGTD